MSTTQKRQRIRVCLKAYDHKLIDVSAEKIVETAKRTDAKVAGPIPLPTKRRLYCVLRSPHVDKKSREHFEMRIHKRIIDIYDPTQQTTEELSRMDLPAGVDIEVKFSLSPEAATSAIKFLAIYNLGVLLLLILQEVFMLFKPVISLERASAM